MLSKIVSRANLKCITSFLIYGSDMGKFYDASDDAQEDILEKRIQALLNVALGDAGEELGDQVFPLIGQLEEIYLGLGIRLGAALSDELRGPVPS